MSTGAEEQRPSDVEPIAAVLRDAEADRTAVGPVSDLVEGGLTLELAHAICESNIARREAAGERVAGFKVGFTNIPIRERMGLPDSTYGYLMEDDVLPSGGALDMADLIAPRIESEICVRLASDLRGTGVTAADVRAAGGSVRASFEVCDARIIDWRCPYPDCFADNGFAARVVLGEDDWRPLESLDLLNESVVLTQNGRAIAEGRGEMALGDPLNAVAWLARKLAERGRALRAGQLVMTGTLTPITPIERGSAYTATFSALGRVEKAFA